MKVSWMLQFLQFSLVIVSILIKFNVILYYIICYWISIGDLIVYILFLEVDVYIKSLFI